MGRKANIKRIRWQNRGEKQDRYKQLWDMFNTEIPSKIRELTSSPEPFGIVPIDPTLPNNTPSRIFGVLTSLVSAPGVPEEKGNNNLPAIATTRQWLSKNIVPVVTTYAAPNWVNKKPSPTKPQLKKYTKLTKPLSEVTEITEQQKPSNQDEQLSSHPTTASEEKNNCLSFHQPRDLYNMQMGMKFNIVGDVYTKGANVLDCDKANFELSFFKEQLIDNKITKLRLSYNTISPGTAKLMGEALKDTPVTTLIIQHTLELEGIQDIVDLIKGTKINTLILRENNIFSDVVEALAKAIKDNNLGIKELDLSYNKIEPETLKWILDYLKDTKVIIDEHIEDNLLEEYVTHEGIYAHTKAEFTSEDTMSLGPIIGKFLVAPVLAIVGTAATIACCVTGIIKKFCDDKNGENNDITMLPVASQGGATENDVPVQRKTTVYSKKYSQAQSPPENGEHFFANGIYGKPSVSTKPLPALPEIENNAYEQIPCDAYIRVSSGRQSMERTVVKLRVVPDATSIIYVNIQNATPPEIGNESTYPVDMGTTNTDTTELQGNMPTEHETHL